MTRKHFEAIAKALRETKATEITCAAVCNALWQANPRMVPAKFMDACGWPIIMNCPTRVSPLLTMARTNQTKNSCHRPVDKPD